MQSWQKLDLNYFHCDETDILKRDERNGCAAQRQHSLDCGPRRGSLISCCWVLVRRRCTGREVAATTALLGSVILLKCENPLSAEMLAAWCHTQGQKMFYFEPIKDAGSCCKKIQVTDNVISLFYTKNVQKQRYFWDLLWYGIWHLGATCGTVVRSFFIV